MEQFPLKKVWKLNSYSTAEDKRMTSRWIGEAEMFSYHASTVGRKLANMELLLEEQGIHAPPHQAHRPLGIHLRETNSQNVWL